MDIGQFGDICIRKGTCQSQARLFFGKCRRCEFKIHFPGFEITEADWGH